jgi:hypothetical protein
LNFVCHVTASVSNSVTVYIDHISDYVTCVRVRADSVLPADIALLLQQRSNWTRARQGKKRAMIRRDARLAAALVLSGPGLAGRSPTPPLGVRAQASFALCTLPSAGHELCRRLRACRPPAAAGPAAPITRWACAVAQYRTGYDTEDEDAIAIMSPSSRKRGHKAR